MKIPFSPPYIDAAVESEVLDALRSGWITTGPKTRRLEEMVAGMTGADRTLCVNSATSGLMLALRWFGIGPGDEVIVPSYTYAATALAVMHIGATPVMVDVREDFCIDPAAVQAAWSTRTKAVIPVDFAGWPCDYAALRSWMESDEATRVFSPAGEAQTTLGRALMLADSAHAFGASYDGRPLGSIADLTVFSFHAVKNVTTAEGGAIALKLPRAFDADREYQTMRLWALNGQTKDALSKSQAGGWRYDILFPGFKMNMPDVLAAIGLGQLQSYLSDTLPKRREIFDTYNAGFADAAWAERPAAEDNRRQSSCHLYPLRVRGISEAQRDAIIDRVAARGIATNVHFVPMPMLTAFRERGYRISEHPVAYALYAREISLPIYPQLGTEQAAMVIEALLTAVEETLRA